MSHLLEIHINNMSTHSNHSDSNYPEDGVSHYPQGKGTKRANSKGPLHNVAKHLTAKTRALRKAMGENGGRHGSLEERNRAGDRLSWAEHKRRLGGK